MKKIELLSPAGNMGSLKAAIYAGADAVYFAGKHFGARSFASNFKEEEIKEAITFAHLYGVKVYITVNTLIYEPEIPSFLTYIDFLVNQNVDALIMQDLGMIDLVHQLYPDLELHASTQVNIHNKEGVLMMKKLGCKRVVMARETPIEQIKKIKKECDIEIEVFGQGALCMSYSGQCYMSYFIGGRSGNRGTCAQCCRQPYELWKENKKVNKDFYLLSTKDLNVLTNLEEFITSGIDSLKIEGRMKRPEYVFAVTKIYRKAIDCFYEKKSFDLQKANREIQKLFHRGFTKGFLFHEKEEQFPSEKRPNHQGIFIGTVTRVSPKKIDIQLTDSLHVQDGIRLVGKEDFGFTVTKMFKQGKPVTQGFPQEKITVVSPNITGKDFLVYKTTDSIQMTNIREEMKKQRKINIKGTFVAKKKEPFCLEITDGIHTIYKQIGKVEEATNYPVTKEIVREKLEKIQDTIYEWESLTISIDFHSFFPIKQLNQLKRECIEALNKQRLERKPVEKKKYSREVPDFPQEKGKTIRLSTEKREVDSTFKEIYVEKDWFDDIKDERKILRLPRIMNTFPPYQQKLLISELGSLYSYQKVETDFSFNVTNSYTVSLLHSLGVLKITLSYELNQKQIKYLIDAYHQRHQKHPNLEVIIEGNLESMILKYNLANHYHIKDQGILKDKYHNQFLLQNKKDYNILYHYQKRKENAENYYELGVNYVRIDL